MCKKSLAMIFFIMTLTIITFASNSYGTVYYVKNSGNDSAAGTSDATSWKTIGKVNSFHLKDGDTVLFKRGSVFVDATLGNPEADDITFADYGTGTKPVLDGDRVAPVDITATTPISNLTIRNLDISGQDWMMSKSSNIYIANVNGVRLSGIIGDGHRDGNNSKGKTAITIKSCTGEVVVENCELYNWGATNLLSSDQDFMGIVIYAQTTGSYIVRDNIVHDIGADGIHLFDSIATGKVSGNTVFNCGEQGIDVKGSSNVRIEDNEFYRTPGFTGQGGTGSGTASEHIDIHEGALLKLAENVVVYKNFFHDGDAIGIRMARVKNVRLENNRFYRLGTAIFIGNPCDDVDIMKNAVVNSFHREYGSKNYEGGGIYENNAGRGVSIHHNTIVNLEGTCTSLATLACCYGTKIYRNIIYNNAANTASMVLGLYINDCGSGPDIRENCIYVSEGNKRVFYKGKVYSVNEVSQWNRIAGGDIFIDPQFANATAQDFRLKAATLCKTNGELWGAHGMADLLPPPHLRMTNVH